MSLYSGHLKDHLAEDYKNVVFSCLSGTHTEADSEVKGPVSCNGRQMDPAMVSYLSVP